MSKTHDDDTKITFVKTPDELPYPTHIVKGIVPHIDSLFAISFEINATWVRTAYQRGQFPWYTEREAVMWYSPNPRMVLYLDEFKCSNSLKKQIKQWARKPELGMKVTVNQAFDQVIHACAHTSRIGQDGSWISRSISRAYKELNREQNAISIELWQFDKLVAGLYGVVLGKMFFGESMFTTIDNGSKAAFTCWVEHLKQLGFEVIDCQQETSHLSSLGARPIPRSLYFKTSRALIRQPQNDMWQQLTQNENLLSYFYKA